MSNPINLVNLREAELVETPAEGATLFCLNPDGTINRVSAANVGGSGGIKTAIIKDSNYDNTLAGVQSAASAAPAVTYECINMTFEEAYQLMASGEPLQVLGMVGGEGEGGMNLVGMPTFTGTAMGVPCIYIILLYLSETIPLYWTADGLSTEAPSQPK